MPRLKTVVMVPKGKEFKAVQRGLRRSKFNHRLTPGNLNQATKFLALVSLPVGPNPVNSFLTRWCEDQESRETLQSMHVIVMGLCGSLTPALTVGDTVLYGQCMAAQSKQSENVFACNTDLPLESAKNSNLSVTIVTGVTCDRVLSTVEEKRQAGQKFEAQVVDMEGWAALNALDKKVNAISILRVVSDAAEHDIPNLDGVFDADGNIRPWTMARRFLGQPIGALRLITGSMAGLRKLEQLAQALGDLGATGDNDVFLDRE